MNYNEYNEATFPELQEEGRRFLKQRDTLVLIILAFIALVGIFAFNGCARNEAAVPDPDKPVPVTVVEARVAPHALQHRISGVAAADEEAVLSFKTGGIVKKIYHDVGDRFHKGDVLALLDTTEVAAIVVDAEQTAKVAASDYERIKRLHETDVATDQQFEAARAGKERAEAGLRRARFNLQHSVIRAPFDGTVNMKLSNRDEIVGAGQPILRVLNSGAGNALTVKASVPATLIPALSEGQEVGLEIEGVATPQTGQILTISHSAEPGTGGFPVKVELPALPILHPGLVVTVSFPGPSEPLIALPAISLSNMDEDRGYVHVVQEKYAARWPVTIAAVTADSIWVEPDMPEGSLVIEQGAAYVSDGRPVSIQEVAR